MFARDFAGAETDFTLAIATSPADDDEAAHGFRSAARIARFRDDEGTGDPGVIDSLKELFALFALPADRRSVLDGSVDAPRDAEGRSTPRRPTHCAAARCRASWPDPCWR